MKAMIMTGSYALKSEEQNKFSTGYDSLAQNVRNVLLTNRF